jgi:transposase
MTNEQRSALERMARSRSLPRRKIVQARALLLAADGVPTNEVARRCHTTDSSVRAWRRRFADHGVEAVGRIAPGRGRKRSVSQEIVEKIVHDTMYTNPDGGKPWTATLMGERFGISRHVVSRIWRDHNLKPSQSGPVETPGGSSCAE